MELFNFQLLQVVTGTNYTELQGKAEHLESQDLDIWRVFNNTPFYWPPHTRKASRGQAALYLMSLGEEGTGSRRLAGWPEACLAC